jgi:hypothetical protein
VISWNAVPIHRMSASSSMDGSKTCANRVCKLGKVVARRLAVRFHNLPV